QGNPIRDARRTYRGAVMSEPIGAVETQNGDDLLAELSEEFLGRYRAGEQPSVDEYAGKHPELAQRIRDLFPAVVLMEQPGATVDLAPAAERVGAIIGRWRDHRARPAP